MIRRNVKRQSSCGTLELPPELACHLCVPSIRKSLIKNTPPKRIKKCSQPWLPKWSNHHKIEKVKFHKKVIEYLNITIENGDELIDTFVYDKAPNIATTTIENSVASEVHENTTHTEISDELDVDDIIQTTVNTIKVFENKKLDDLKRYAILKGVTDSPFTLLSLENRCKEFLDSDLFCSDKRGEGETGSIYSDKSKAMIRMIDQTVSSRKKIVTISFPDTHEVKLRCNISMLKSKAARFDSLINSLYRQCYSGSDVGDRLFGVAASMIPQADMNGIATVAPMIVSAILANVGVSINTSRMVDNLPNAIQYQRW